MYKNTLNMSFKTNHTFFQRQLEADRIKEKYPDRIPVICEIEQNKQNSFTLKKNKYLVPNTLTVGQFVYVLRKQISLKQEEAVFLMINNCLPPTSALMSHIYKEHKDEDGFLYATLARENTFG